MILNVILPRMLRLQIKMLGTLLHARSEICPEKYPPPPPTKKGWCTMTTVHYIQATFLQTREHAMSKENKKPTFCWCACCRKLYAVDLEFMGVNANARQPWMGRPELTLLYGKSPSKSPVTHSAQSRSARIACKATQPRHFVETDNKNEVTRRRSWIAELFVVFFALLTV